jgi:ABC-type transport system substrate-binding protein
MTRLHRVLLGLFLAGIALAATPATVATAAPAAATTTSVTTSTVIGDSPTTLRACVYGRGTVFNPGTGCRSDNALFLMQTDGNLVLYRADGRPKWHAGTYGNPGAFAVFQNDGNFVVYSASRDRALWNSRTYGRGGDRLAVQDDGNVVIYARSGAVLWWV